MRIQLASDLHLEHHRGGAPHGTLIQPAPGADLLVLAGDIHNGVAGIEAFRSWPVPVVCVAGNHEFYDGCWEQIRQDLRQACAGTRVVVLDNDALVIDGVRILGCTLWTDFRLAATPQAKAKAKAQTQTQAQTQAQAMATVERGLTDYRVIGTRSGPLRAQQTLADHEHSRRWLEVELARDFAGPTVVITHHGPHPLSIHPRFAGHPINPGFVSDLTPLLGRADLWLHGHTHDSFDYRVGRCRVVANPAGYPLGRSAADAGPGLRLENAAFQPGLVIDVAAGPRES